MATIKLINIVKSWKPDKKFVALFEVDGRSRNVHFGSATSQTYAEGADEKKETPILRGINHGSIRMTTSIKHKI